MANVRPLNHDRDVMLVSCRGVIQVCFLVTRRGRFVLSWIERGPSGTERKITPATNNRVARCHAIDRAVT